MEATFTFTFPILTFSLHFQSTIISSFLQEATDPTAPLKLENVTGATLQIVIDWLKEHKDDGPFDEKASEEKKAEDIADWDREFLAVSLIFLRFSAIVKGYPLVWIINYTQIALKPLALLSPLSFR